MSELKQTALFSAHKDLKAKLVGFGGWNMPIQYKSGVLAEHKAVRESCGIFDVSHMGEILVEGEQALDFLQFATINDLNRLSPNNGQYTAMLNEKGGMVDDLILYQLGEKSYLLCVNAANTDKDFAHLLKLQQEHCSHMQVSVENHSDRYSQIAVQGPQSLACLKELFSESSSELEALEYMQLTTLTLDSLQLLVARTGYTGELGYELYLPNELALKLWAALIEKGAQPIGLGARDTLRLEACYLLYGNDMDDEVSPIEAGISWAVRMEKGEFLGKPRLVNEKEQPSSRRKSVAFTMSEKAIARSGMDIYKDGVKIGRVTSGSFLPSLDNSGGLALISFDSATTGDEVEIEIRGKRKLAKIVKRPLYSPKVKTTSSVN